ncbi:MAG: cysteine desulfurase [Limnochordaceae bacterium]|nr:cysteine desulfurase [Limnochordaceae bacterium]
MAEIYLDNAASVPMCAAAKATMRRVLEQGLADANPSSPHAPGRRVRALLDEARATAARWLGCSPGEIVFTSGGTEADNLALIGAATASRREEGRSGVVVSAIEHHAVLDAARALEARGFVVELAGSDGSGVVRPEQVRRALERVQARGARVGVIALMLVNNEVGTVQPVEDVAELAASAGARFFVDAVQAPFHAVLDPGSLGCDLLALSAHKMGGPKGAGLVYVRRGIPFDPVAYGGGQERMLRPGTENVPGILGMAAALEWARSEREAIEAHKAKLERDLLDHLRRLVPDVEINTGAARRSPGLVNLWVPGVESQVLLAALDMAGVACSYGAACTSGALQPSHVLQAMGFDEQRVASSIRVSVGPFNTEAEMAEAASRMAHVIRALRTSGERGPDACGSS